MIDLLLNTADKYGFPIREESEDCTLAWLHQLNAWMSDRHSLFVQVDCFNAYFWGFKIYDLSGEELDKGAPIVDEEDAQFDHLEDALTAGLLKAFESFQLA